MRKSTLIITLAILLAVLAPMSANAYPIHPTRPTQRAHKRTIISELKRQHVKRANRRMIVEIGWRESGWDRLARNGSCLGAFQLKTQAPYSKWSNLRWNTRAALRYIKRRYGTVAKAKAHSDRYGWY